ncbi:MAG TPA: YidB family protein [Leptospiraceae bacterium]|nr:YidB family protein [Leptospiraceae bacterium]HMY65738.1 YidB family protein [Leptospiraceae bacterium]HNF17126.1 YidB family protein [Leptospiraceae bacterium]HNF24016.1 YidB family protein [Leptospiraceae bacterium]HNI98865.1 YidB family protein [Leptospiraceae bacterium]
MSLIKTIIEAVSDSDSELDIGGITKLAKALLGSDENSDEEGATVLDTILSALKEGGMEDKVDSWVGKGKNKSISEEDIEEVLDEDTIEFLCEKTGLEEETLMTGLKFILPIMVDKMSPDGEMESGGLLATGIKLLKDFL